MTLTIDNLHKSEMCYKFCTSFGTWNSHGLMIIGLSLNHIVSKGDDCLFSYPKPPFYCYRAYEWWEYCTQYCSGRPHVGWRHERFGKLFSTDFFHGHEEPVVRSKWRSRLSGFEEAVVRSKLWRRRLSWDKVDYRSSCRSLKICFTFFEF